MLNTVKVFFANPAFNYVTNVSAGSTFESCKSYFVGAWFNVGSYPAEIMARCTSIDFIKNPKNL